LEKISHLGNTLKAASVIVEKCDSQVVPGRCAVVNK